MRDSEVVAAIVAGNPEGLAEAYDRYASPLYTYCRSLLREPADAADAVQDTFVIAASRLAELRDRNRLRPWLYAVARNECHRRLRARTVQVTTPLDEMPDVTDTSADVSGEAERDELRTLLRSAVRGLNSGEQDLIELQLRQGLDAAEIAAVLGVSRNHAHALLSRARDQLEISLGALLVARSGRDDCAALNTMLADWDGQLNVLMRKRINRHIENCPVCAERKKRELAPALLLGLAPLAALSTGAVPPGLREQVLRLASSNTPDAAAHRASVAQRTAPFGHHGFPKPLDPPKSSWWQTRSGQAAAAAAAAAVVAALTLLAVALASSGAGHPGGAAAALGPGAGPGTSIAAASGTAGGPGSGAPGSGGSGGRSSNHPQPTVSANGAANVSPTPGAGGAPAPGGGGAPTGGGSGTTPGHSGHPSPPTSAPPSSSSAKASSPAPATSSATATASSSPSRGILAVTPTTILVGLNGGTLTLKASFGSVSWSIAESSSLVGQVTVSPTAGTLASGQSTTVSLSADSLLGGLREAAPAGGGGGAGACAACTLTVNPGNITVTVELEISMGNSSSPPPSSPPPSSPPPSSPPPDDVRPAALVGRLVN
ncbi:MAG: sigma-70 family RNA polymerase sigma factor [Streptosporangiaceae bacterium]